MVLVKRESGAQESVGSLAVLALRERGVNRARCYCLGKMGPDGLIQTSPGALLTLTL